MSAWLITGGAGFIGSNFVRSLAAAATPAQIVVLDALTYAGNLASIAELIDARRISLVHGDIRDPLALAELFASHDFQRVVHFAAESHVDRSILGPRAFIETNITGTLNLLAAARDRWQGSYGGRLFLHVSTDEVFGSLAPAAPPFNESTPYAPNSPYAASKAAADHLVRAWHHTYGFPAIITNCSNNYGPYQFPEKLIPLMILNALGGRAAAGLRRRPAGARLAARAGPLRRAALVLERGTVGETYNIGSGQQHANLEVVSAICDLVASGSARRRARPRQLIRSSRTARATTAATRSIAARSGANLAGRRAALDVFAAGARSTGTWHNEWVASIRAGEYLRFYEQQYSQRLRKTS